MKDRLFQYYTMRASKGGKIAKKSDCIRIENVNLTVDGVF